MSIKYIQNSSGHVLVVDDEVAVGYLVREILSTHGYEVSLFNNSREALGEFEKTPHKFDLIITDQSMPEMTGTELMEKLIAIRSDIPILISSGDSHKADIEKALMRGAYGYIDKPINMGSFLKLIRSALACTSELN